MNTKLKIDDKNRFFLDEILQTTYASRIQIDLKIEKEIVEKRDELDKLLTKVFGQVTYNWKSKVRNSALRGKCYANLFFFNNQQELDLFFIKNELYNKAGLVPPYIRLESYFSSFGFDFKLVRKNGVLLAQVCWDKYLDKGLSSDDKSDIIDKLEEEEEILF